MEPAAAAAAEAAAPEPLIPQAPEVVVLQASAIVDHVCSVEEALLASLVQDEIGGSRRASLAELSHLLAQVMLPCGYSEYLGYRARRSCCQTTAMRRSCWATAVLMPQ